MKTTARKHFVTVWKARKNVTLLEQPFTDEQFMNEAATQFIKAHGQDAKKAERTWNMKPETKRTWTNFKKFWKEEIHMWNLLEPQGNKVEALKPSQNQCKEMSLPSRQKIAVVRGRTKALVPSSWRFNRFCRPNRHCSQCHSSASMSKMISHATAAGLAAMTSVPSQR